MCSLIFSIIVPTYKDDIRLNLCLLALSKQNYSVSKFEVIVVNNDPSKPVYIEKENFNKLNLSVLDEFTPGSYAARNAGIKVAKGQILAFTDSDCIPDKAWLKRAERYFDLDNERKLGIVAGEIKLFFRDKNKLTKTEIYEQYTGFTQKQYAKEGNCVTANWFSYSDRVIALGGFNSKLKSNGDSELSKEISNNYSVVFAGDVIVFHPARYKLEQIVGKYKRLIGGAYIRRFEGHPIRFLFQMIQFTFRRIKFLLKKIFTVSPKESYAIAIVTWHISLGGWQEYFSLINGKDTKR